MRMCLEWVGNTGGTHWSEVLAFSEEVQVSWETRGMPCTHSRVRVRGCCTGEA